MYIYNVTIKVDWSIHEKWLTWMLEIETYRMTAGPYLTNHQLLRLNEIDEADGPTYAVQYHTSSLEMYKAYVDEQMAVDNAASYALWGQHCVFFTTIMKVVS